MDYRANQEILLGDRYGSPVQKSRLGGAGGGQGLDLAFSGDGKTHC